MPPMTITGTPLFRQKLTAAGSAGGLADAIGVSRATIGKLSRDERGIGTRVIAGALTYWAPLRFEDLFQVVPDPDADAAG